LDPIAIEDPSEWIDPDDSSVSTEP
jgi:hypothetical protein